MLRSTMLLFASLLLAQRGYAAPAPVARGGGSLGHLAAPSAHPPSAGTRAPVPRGGSGTLGRYLGRAPSSSRVVVPGGYYPGGYYPYRYGDGFYEPFLFDPFFAPGYGYSSYGYGSDYGASDDWSKRGNVQLHVDPKDVEVIVDGIPSAHSGRADLNLPTGTHHIEIVHPGYQPWNLDLNVQQGVRYRLDQRLERLSKEEQASGADRPTSRGVGELRLNVRPSDTIVDLDGRLLGMADLLRGSQALQGIPLGRHTLRFTHPGCQTIEKQIDVTTDHPAEVSVELQRE